MILYDHFREELIEQIELSDSIFFIRNCGKTKTDILTDGVLICRMVKAYQKNRMDYGMDSYDAYSCAMKTVFEIDEWK